MITKPKDFDKARAYGATGDFNPLPLGGHVCRIVGAQEKKSKNGNDMIEVAFDIAEGSEYDGRFNERFKELRKDKPDAKWPNAGMFRTITSTKDGNCSSYFKGLITAIEESNAGFNFWSTGGDERTLKNKMVGFVFGEEEYTGSDGKVHTAVKAVYAVSVDRVREGIEPPAKKTVSNGGGNLLKEKGFKEVTDEEPLPF